MLFEIQGLIMGKWMNNCGVVRYGFMTEAEIEVVEEEIEREMKGNRGQREW